MKFTTPITLLTLSAIVFGQASTEDPTDEVSPTESAYDDATGEPTTTVLATDAVGEDETTSTVTEVLSTTWTAEDGESSSIADQDITPHGNTTSPAIQEETENAAGRHLATAGIFGGIAAIAGALLI